MRLTLGYVGWLSFFLCAQAAADATISGTVTDAVTADPIVGAEVFLVDHSPGAGGIYPALSTTTDATGSYSITIPFGAMQHQKCTFNACAFPFFDFQGTSVGIEVAASGYDAGRWSSSGTNSVSCYFGCDRLSLAAVADEDIVLDTATVTAAGTDVALSAGASQAFTGSIVDDATGAPLPGASILIVADEINGVSGVADAGGAFASTPLPSSLAATVIAYATNDYSATNHSGAVCDVGSRACTSPTLTSPSDGSLTFRMKSSASIGVSLSDFPAYIDTMASPTNIFRPRIYNTLGEQIDQFTCALFEPNSSCEIKGLAGGAYYIVFTSIHRGAADRLDDIATVREFHDGTLTSCGGFLYDFDKVTPFYVAPGGRRDFQFPSLQQGFFVRGTVTMEDGMTAPPVDTSEPSPDFELYDAATGRSAGLVYTTFDGQTVSFRDTCAAPPPGTYALRTYSKIDGRPLSQRGILASDAVATDLVCQGEQCDYGSATGVSGGDTVNVRLSTGASISGCLVDSMITPVPDNESRNTNVLIFNETGRLYETSNVIVAGQVCYESGQLPAGSYWIRTSNGTASIKRNESLPASARSPFFDTVLGGASGNTCSGNLCSFAGINPVVTDGATDVVGQDLMLTEGNVITGRLLNADTGALLVRGNSVTVRLLASDGAVIGDYQVADDGVFQTVAVPDGQYYLQVIDLLSGDSASATPAKGIVAPAGAQSIVVSGASVDAGVLDVDRPLVIDGFES